MKRVAILGSTGSIGTSCLDVLRSHRQEMRVVGLTAHRRWEQLADQSREFEPALVAIGDERLRTEIPAGRFGASAKVCYGASGIEEVAAHPEVDVVVAGIVGAAGIRGAWVALEQGKTVGLANKETMVVAGPLVTQLVRERGATLLPVDSEHSAIAQCLQAGRRSEVRQIILTASGGPFRGWRREQLANVTPKMALAHPTWNMGPKISVDSATMMNKALEIIEARWLFDIPVEQISVVIHPQSVVHSMVEFVDGSVVAQLSPPDMRLPIQYALTWPERLPGISPRLDMHKLSRLDFEPPDEEAFPALTLGYEVARRGGTCGAVLNAANEAAVARFLAGELGFLEIPRACRAVLENHHFDPRPTLDELFRLDAWAREEIVKWNSLS